MKTLLSLILVLFFSQFQSQLKKVDIADFYNWTANNGTHYQFILLSENLAKLDTAIPAVIRVRYSTDGGVTYKTAEFDANLTLNQDKKSAGDLVIHINAGKTARIIQGDGGYTPDNFILYYDKDGNFLRGYQADHTELAKSNVEYAKVFHTAAPTADQMRSLIRLFYKSSDALYRDLMTFAAQYD